MKTGTCSTFVSVSLRLPSWSLFWTHSDYRQLWNQVSRTVVYFMQLLVCNAHSVNCWPLVYIWEAFSWSGWVITAFLPARAHTRAPEMVKPDTSGWLPRLGGGVGGCHLRASVRRGACDWFAGLGQCKHCWPLAQLPVELWLREPGLPRTSSWTCLIISHNSKHSSLRRKQTCFCSSFRDAQLSSVCCCTHA